MNKENLILKQSFNESKKHFLRLNKAADNIKSLNNPFKIISVVGARPNFMKMAPIHKELKKQQVASGQPTVQHLICHTGMYRHGVQNYDDKMRRTLELENANVKWFLSIDRNDLPREIVEKKKTTLMALQTRIQKCMRTSWQETSSVSRTLEILLSLCIN